MACPRYARLRRRLWLRDSCDVAFGLTDVRRICRLPGGLVRVVTARDMGTSERRLFRRKLAARGGADEEETFARNVTTPEDASRPGGCRVFREPLCRWRVGSVGRGPSGQAVARVGREDPRPARPCKVSDFTAFGPRTDRRGATQRGCEVRRLPDSTPDVDRRGQLS